MFAFSIVIPRRSKYWREKRGNFQKIEHRRRRAGRGRGGSFAVTTGPAKRLRKSRGSGERGLKNKGSSRSRGLRKRGWAKNAEGDGWSDVKWLPGKGLRRDFSRVTFLETFYSVTQMQLRRGGNGIAAVVSGCVGTVWELGSFLWNGRKALWPEVRWVIEEDTQCKIDCMESTETECKPSFWAKQSFFGGREETNGMICPVSFWGTEGR
jgi:hypothetical protein